MTPEALVLGRRAALAGAGAVALAAPALAQAAAGPARNPKYVAGRDITPEKYATTYNNYYEFSDGKNLWEAAQVLKPRPWTISLEGQLKQPRTIGDRRPAEAGAARGAGLSPPLRRGLGDDGALDRLPAQPAADDRGAAGIGEIHRVRDGAGHKMPGLQSPFYPWPYIEGLTMDEAANELAFVSTGLYGKPLPPQNGGPIRLTVPWKYGFKSCKALAKISFTEKRPVNFWQAIQPSEYGFWANVNPDVAHPRWSQARERLLGNNEMVPTQIYNGYGEFVASLYSDRKNEKLFM